MKSKLKKNSKIKNIKAISKAVNKNGFPAPKKEKCFEKGCRQIIEVKYVVPNKSWSKVNNYEYWVNPASKNPDFWKDKEARKNDRYICNQHLLSLYYDKERYWETIPDLKVRGKLKTYIFNNTISSQ